MCGNQMSGAVQSFNGKLKQPIDKLNGRLPKAKFTYVNTIAMAPGTISPNGTVATHRRNVHVHFLDKVYALHFLLPFFLIFFFFFR